MAHAQVSVEPYGGTEKEDFSEFEQLFQGYIEVATIPNAQQANFLQLHLRDNALRFYQTLGPATRANVPASLIALRDHFCNPQLQEVHVLKLEQLRFNPKTDTPENFLVNLTKKAQRAYPTPDLPAVAPIDGTLNGAALDADTARFHRETAQRQERIDAVNDNRNEQLKRLFIKGMPGWLRSKLMEQPSATTVQELCNLTKKQITIREICRKDDYPEDGFNEINDKVSENLISAITKLSTNQEKMEKQLNEMRSQITEQSNKQSNPLPEQNRNNNSQSDQYSGQQPNTNTWYGQQRGNRGGRRRNNWQKNLISTILSQTFTICHQLHNSHIRNCTLKISSTQTSTKINSQWFKCIHQHNSNSPRIIRRNNLSRIKCHKLKRKIQTDLSYQ